jgi:peroxiredoxin
MSSRSINSVLARAAAVAALAVAVRHTPLRADDEMRALKLGSVMPMATAKMQSVDGRAVTLADIKGKKGTVVVFTCNVCPFAKAWEERIVAVGNEWSKKGVGVIAINSNDPLRSRGDDLEAMQARAKERAMAYPYVVDATSNVARAFGATHTPEVFVFDARGRLVYHGAVDDSMEPGQVQQHYLADVLNALVKSKKIVLAETKAMGCSIKYRAKA